MPICSACDGMQRRKEVDAMPTKEELRYFQAMPLEVKIGLTKNRIREWVREYGTGGVYVSFSGGKDSTVLLHIVREMYPEVEAVFVNTGLEYPEIQQFVKTFDNVTILRPTMRFDEVIKKYGYPIIGKRQAEAIDLGKKNIKHNKYTLRLATLGIDVDEAEKMGLTLPAREMLDRYKRTQDGSKYNAPKYKPLLKVDFRVSAECCAVMKKRPIKAYAKATGKNPIIATMATESMVRESSWLKNGCNAFDSKEPKSAPMSFWTEQDVLHYIKRFNVPIAPVYGEVVYIEDPEQMRIEEMGVDGFGEEKLKTTGCDRTGCIFCAFGCHRDTAPSRFQQLQQTHPRQYAYCIGGGEYDENGVWKPNKGGLGMGHVFDELNKIYGDGFIKY